MKTITLYDQEKVADHQMTNEEMQNYADQNEVSTHGFAFITRDEAGEFNMDYLDKHFKTFHSSSVLFAWQEEMFN